MKVKELIEKLERLNPEAEVLIGKNNGEVETYAVVDYVHHFKYEMIYADFYGTPGPMDKRLFSPELKDESDICMIGSLFPYKHTL